MLNITAIVTIYLRLPCRDGSLILLAGDSGIAGQRFKDFWILQNPTQQPPVWQTLEQSSQTTVATHSSSSSSAGDKQEKDSTGGYTARSNSAAAVAGDWLCLFGGWDVTGVLAPIAMICFADKAILPLPHWRHTRRTASAAIFGGSLLSQ